MFTVIDGAVALLRKPKGVYVQAPMYARLNYKVIEFDGFDPKGLQ